ncbi:MAG: Fur family transcriptional regulator [Gloeomargarita sp. SKYBB_i_bin120]|nr:transcriptional repressor [Gloeomargarita sp. SKYG98]MCS7292517.1 transcriptional repressor [Gloeomargarita sp. SKYB120]MDW8178078.1 Fur family transcriptional regulator [Gloeomargarita sp. SKYBB_i_bin120]
MTTASLTPSQQRILALLQAEGQALSAQAIYLRLKQLRQGVGLATVYRALEVLKKNGVVQMRLLPSGEAVYSARLHDRHHLTCLRCNASIPLRDCPLEDLEQYLQNMYNFKVYYHTLEFFGVCPQCQAQSLA